MTPTQINSTPSVDLPPDLGSEYGPLTGPPKPLSRPHRLGGTLPLVGPAEALSGPHRGSQALSRGTLPPGFGEVGRA
jgi:hypothetical protein